METTRGDPGTAGSDLPDELRWCVTLVHGRDPALLGRRALLGRARPRIELGRTSDALGPGALDEPRISRRHAALELHADGRLALHDLGSHNGTELRGQRVDHADLADGDIVALGGTLLLVHRVPSACLPRPSDGIDGVGHAHARLLDAVDKVAARATPVLLCGETGAGKSHVAAELHRRSGRRGPLVTVDCGAVPASLVHEDLFGADGRSGCLARARGGTLVLDAVGDADPTFQRCALALLDRAEASEDVRVIACRTDGGGQLRGDLEARLARWVIHLAPLRARREDIPVLARAFAARGAAGPSEPHIRLARALLAHDWPGNLRELAAVIECAVIDAGDARTLPLSDGARRLLGRVRVDPTPPPALAGAVVIAASGHWFEPLGGERVNLDHRPNLCRLLHALVEQLRERPAEPLPLAQLLLAGWPGERVREAAGANRVHVALTTLRKLGLREVIVRERSGYRIDPALVVAIAGG